LVSILQSCKKTITFQRIFSIKIVNMVQCGCQATHEFQGVSKVKKPLLVSLATAAMLTLSPMLPNAHAQTNAVTQAEVKGTVTASFLNVRSMPSTSGAKLGVLSKGMVVSVKRAANGWAEINYKGKTAYVSSKYLQLNGQAPVVNKTAQVTASVLNVRSMPSTSGAIRGTLVKNQVVPVTQVLSNGWVQIVFNGKTAYVSGKYVIIGNQTTQPTNPTNPPTAPTNPNPAPAAGQLSAYELKVVELTNAERAKAGLPALQIDPKLSQLARLKSQDMLNKNYFSHTSPTYGSPFDMMKQFGITYRSAGENIAMGQRTPEEVVSAWMNSPGHKANILNSSYTHIGVGHVGTKNHWTQMFIGK
jgi:uncharacterized YkwD family protein